MGIDVDVANAIGDVMGVDVEILDMEFDAIITSVQAGKADAGIAGITVTPERKKNIGFTDSYADVRQVIMVNSNEVKAAGNQPGVIDKFKSCFIDDNRYQYLLQGLGNTLIITFFAIILSVILGTLIAIVRARHECKGLEDSEHALPAVPYHHARHANHGAVAHHLLCGVCISRCQ